MVLFSITISLCSSLNIKDEVSHPRKTKGNTIVSCILIFMFLDSYYTVMWKLMCWRAACSPLCRLPYLHPLPRFAVPIFMCSEMAQLLAMPHMMAALHALSSPHTRRNHRPLTHQLQSLHEKYSSSQNVYCVEYDKYFIRHI
jgi:Sec-independent protein secretion pathway component TatC